MAPVCLDITPLGKLVDRVGWYADLRRDIEERNIHVLLGHGKFKQEVERYHKVKLFLIELAKIGKARSVDKKKVSRIMAEFKKEPAARCQECDDPHLFAICTVGATTYLFTEDKRLGKCRQRIRNSSLRAYCQIKMIRDSRRYRDHRQRIIA